ncbi:MAG: hypothetical protein ACO3CH_00300 [Ilumatobacteraceae bacterium]
MVPTPFPTPLDKLALAVSSAVEVKEQTVREYGIGEDININLYTWTGPFLSAICQMSSQLMIEPHEKRFGRVVDAAVIIRQALGIDAITMIAEGYISTDPRMTEDMTLAQAFVKLPEVVKECITFTHVYEEQVLFLTKPYKYTVPRSVVWEDEIFTPGQTIMRGGNGKYPLMFSKVLNEVEIAEPPEDKVVYYETLGRGLRQLGFEITWL